jgi:glycosyltransferase involved in cell wall biosynthesis
MLGVSIVICCHNSSARLGETLGHLSRQVVPAALPWEVIVVDNGSTDDTAVAAERIWASNSVAPLRVVSETKLGLSFARARGMREARYDCISLVDDDNWVCPDWVRLVSEIMTAHPETGACGGISVAACEVSPPWWFSKFARSYAVGEVAPEAGDVTWSKGYLWGAGLTLRKSAWHLLHERGFTPRLTDRSGTNLSSGGDGELCMALRLAGWALYYDPRLHLRHFIPVARLDWTYLRRLRRALGACSVAIDAYTFAVRPAGSRIKKWVRENWFYQLLTTFKELIACGAMAFDARKRASEGSATALQAEWLLGRFQELKRGPLVYDRAVREVCKAPWQDQSRYGNLEPKGKATKAGVDSPVTG